MLHTENVLGLRKIGLAEIYQEITPYKKNGLIFSKEDFVIVLIEELSVVEMTQSHFIQHQAIKNL